MFHSVQKWSLLLAIAGMLNSAPAQAAPANLPFHVEYQASYPANLYWLLNVLAGDPRVKADRYRSLWQQTGPAEKDDAAYLKRFAEVRARYRGALREETSPENGMMPSPPSYGVDVATKFSALFLSSATLGEVWSKAEILLSEDDEQELRDVVAHFEPRFAHLWQQEHYIENYRTAFQRYAATQGLDRELDQFRRFYGVPDDRPMHMRVQFVFVPGNGETFARSIGNNLVVEIPSGEKPADQIDVVAHEICHYFYARAGVEGSAAYNQGIFATHDAVAAPAYGLLNEGLATALQAIVKEKAEPAQFARDFKRPYGLYDDHAIDTYAKALFPLVKGAIADHHTLAQIAPQCVTAYGKAFAAEPLAPSDFLQDYLLCARNPHGAYLDSYFEALPPRSLWSYRLADGKELADALHQYAAISCVVAVTQADWPMLTVLHNALPSLPATPPSEAGVFTLKRPMNGYAFVVYGHDDAALSRALGRFARAKRLNDGWHAYPEAARPKE